MKLTQEQIKLAILALEYLQSQATPDTMAEVCQQFGWQKEMPEEPVHVVFGANIESLLCDLEEQLEDAGHCYHCGDCGFSEANVDGSECKFCNSRYCDETCQAEASPTEKGEPNFTLDL